MHRSEWKALHGLHIQQSLLLGVHGLQDPRLARMFGSELHQFQREVGAVRTRADSLPIPLH